MALAPELIDFQHTLDAAGVIVAVHSDHLCVRLPLLTSVRVRYDGTRLIFEPRFGAASRAMGTANTFVAAAAGTCGLLFTGAALPFVGSIAVLGVLGVVHDTMRYIVTESAVTRVALLWSAYRGAPSTPGALGAGAAWPLRPQAGETVRPSPHVE